MRPIDQQVILVTGATDGLGRQVAEALAARGATVLLHGRDDQRLATAAEGIRAATGRDRLRTCRADFASLPEVRGLAGQVESDHDHLDALVNNAGIGSGPRQLSADGHELRFQVTTWRTRC